MKQRRKIDIPATSAGNFDTRMREVVQVFMGLRGDPLDRAVTVRDLEALGLASAGGPDGDGDLAPGPAIPRPPADGALPVDATPPPTPTGFALDAGITNVFVTHDRPGYTHGGGHDRTVLYGVRLNPGDPLPTFAEAAKLSDFMGEIYAYPSDPATSWRMWITWRSVGGVESVTPAGGVNGLPVRTGEDVQRLLDALAGQITGSELNRELSATIDDATEGVAYLGTQYGMRVQVAADGRRLVGGYGLMGSNSAERGPSIDFGVLANRFYVGAPAQDGNVSSVQPFVIQTTPVTINGVLVPAGVYMADAFIKNGTITNAKIANAAIDDAKVASLSASKLRAGSISVGEYIQSSNYVSSGGVNGWRIDGSGNAIFRNATMYGGVYANYGQIGGITISGGALYTSAYGSGGGFYLGSDGRFSLGSKLTWNGTTLSINGSGTFSGALQAATGTFAGALMAASGTFTGALQAATGTFSGKLTAQAIDAVQTINIAGNAVTVPASATGSYMASVSMYFPEATPVTLVGTFTQGDGRHQKNWYLVIDGTVVYGPENPIAGTLGAMSLAVTVGQGSHYFAIQTDYQGGDARCAIVALGTRR